MSLKSRLTISHLLVVVVFLGLHVSFFMAMVFHPPYSLGRVPRSHELQAALARPQPSQQLAEVLASLNLPPTVAVTLYPPDSPPVELKKPDPEAATDRLSRARQAASRGRFMQTQEESAWFETSNGLVRVSGISGPPPPNAAFRHILTAGLFAGLAALLLAPLVSRAVVRPVAKLVEVAERFGPNHLEVRVPETGPPELMHLAASFNRMADRLATTVDELRRQKERAEAIEASRRQFLGEVSHNLRTPLAAILGWTDTLLDGLAKGEETSYLQRIRREAVFVSRTVGRLLDLSRWEQAEPILTSRPFPLAEVVFEVAENLEDAAAENHIELALKLDPDCVVLADRHRTRDLFQILLENVIEHAGNDVLVEIEARPERGRVEVVIRDNGCGLPPELLANFGSPGVSPTGRTSLGLAIATRLARAHGDELKLAPPATGTGTVAKFSLPLGKI